MCQMIYFPGRDEPARTVGELTAILGGRPVCDDRDTYEDCLCGTDVKATARKFGWKSKGRTDGDWEFTKKGGA